MWLCRHPWCHRFRVRFVTEDGGDLGAARTRLAARRKYLGGRLALYRTAAGVSQPELGAALGRTRTTISKVEHGTRGMPAALWALADEVCRADGALIADHQALAEAEDDYRGLCRARQRQQRQAAAQAEVERVRAALSPVAWPPDRVGGHDGWPGMGLVHGELAEELMAVVTRLVRTMGRRDAMRTAGLVLAAVGLSNLDADECARVAQALESPERIDAQVIRNLAASLTQSKRLEDKLGPGEVLDTVVSQHGLVRRLRRGRCPEHLVKPLCVVDSNMASTIGTCLLNMNQPEAATGYFGHARKAGHDAGNAGCAAYAAANACMAAFLRGDTPTALDTAAAARSLAARTDDAQLKALTEQMAAAAYARDGQYGPCMAASSRAHELLDSPDGRSADSPAYWVHHGTVDSQRSLFLCLLGRPKDAVEAATNARARFNRTFVGSYGRCQVRLGHALALSKEIPEAAGVLGDAAGHADLSPRLTQELHAARALMQPWENTKPVKTLDTRLQAHGLLPTS